MDALKPFVCRCGLMAFATEAEQRDAQPNGLHKCPQCRTFSTDHPYSGDGFDHCFVCDARPWSHR